MVGANQWLYVNKLSQWPGFAVEKEEWFWATFLCSGEWLAFQKSTYADSKEWISAGGISPGR